MFPVHSVTMATISYDTVPISSPCIDQNLYLHEILACSNRNSSKDHQSSLFFLFPSPDIPFPRLQVLEVENLFTLLWFLKKKKTHFWISPREIILGMYSFFYETLHPYIYIYIAQSWPCSNYGRDIYLTSFWEYFT